MAKEDQKRFIKASLDVETILRDHWSLLDASPWSDSRVKSVMATFQALNQPQIDLNTDDGKTHAVGQWHNHKQSVVNDPASKDTDEQPLKTEVASSNQTRKKWGHVPSDPLGPLAPPNENIVSDGPTALESEDSAPAAYRNDELGGHFEGEEPIQGYHYQLVRPIGFGGAGVVWEATYGTQKCAMKILHPKSNLLVKKELDSLRHALKLKHPLICRIQGIWIIDESGNIQFEEAEVLEQLAKEGDSQGSSQSSGKFLEEKSSKSKPVEVFIAMQLGDKTLADELRDNEEIARSKSRAWYQKLLGFRDDSAIRSRLWHRELLGFMSDAAVALDHLNHKLGFQHNDIKPANLLVVSGSVQVCDFTLLRRNGDKPRTAAYSKPYVAPEIPQKENHKNSDQFSLAISYLHLRLGRLPYSESILDANSDESFQDAKLEKNNRRVDWAELPWRERRVLRRALAVDPDKRYKTSTEFVNALKHASRVPWLEFACTFVFLVLCYMTVDGILFSPSRDLRTRLESLKTDVVTWNQTGDTSELPWADNYVVSILKMHPDSELYDEHIAVLAAIRTQRFDILFTTRVEASSTASKTISKLKELRQELSNLIQKEFHGELVGDEKMYNALASAKSRLRVEQKATLDAYFTTSQSNLKSDLERYAAVEAIFMHSLPEDGDQVNANTQPGVNEFSQFLRPELRSHLKKGFNSIAARIHSHITSKPDKAREDAIVADIEKTRSAIDRPAYSLIQSDEEVAYGRASFEFACRRFEFNQTRDEQLLAALPTLDKFKQEHAESVYSAYQLLRQTQASDWVSKQSVVQQFVEIVDKQSELSLAESDALNNSRSRGIEAARNLLPELTGTHRALLAHIYPDIEFEYQLDDVRDLVRKAAIETNRYDRALSAVQSLDPKTELSRYKRTGEELKLSMARRHHLAADSIQAFKSKKSKADDSSLFEKLSSPEREMWQKQLTAFANASQFLIEPSKERIPQPEFALPVIKLAQLEYELNLNATDEQALSELASILITDSEFHPLLDYLRLAFLSNTDTATLERLLQGFKNGVPKSLRNEKRRERLDKALTDRVPDIKDELSRLDNEKAFAKQLNAKTSFMVLTMLDRLRELGMTALNPTEATTHALAASHTPGLESAFVAGLLRRAAKDDHSVRVLYELTRFVDKQDQINAIRRAVTAAVDSPFVTDWEIHSLILPQIDRLRSLNRNPAQAKTLASLFGQRARILWRDSDTIDNLKLKGRAVYQKRADAYRTAMELDSTNPEYQVGYWLARADIDPKILLTASAPKPSRVTNELNPFRAIYDAVYYEVESKENKSVIKKREMLELATKRYELAAKKLKQTDSWERLVQDYCYNKTAILGIERGFYYYMIKAGDKDVREQQEKILRNVLKRCDRAGTRNKHLMIPPHAMLMAKGFAQEDLAQYCFRDTKTRIKTFKEAIATLTQAKGFTDDKDFLHELEFSIVRINFRQAEISEKNRLSQLREVISNFKALLNNQPSGEATRFYLNALYSAVDAASGDVESRRKLAEKLKRECDDLLNDSNTTEMTKLLARFYSAESMPVDTPSAEENRADEYTSIVNSNEAPTDLRFEAIIALLDSSIDKTPSLTWRSDFVRDKRFQHIISLMQTFEKLPEFLADGRLQLRRAEFDVRKAWLQKMLSSKVETPDYSNLVLGAKEKLYEAHTRCLNEVGKKNEIEALEKYLRLIANTKKSKDTDFWPAWKERVRFAELLLSSADPAHRQKRSFAIQQLKDITTQTQTIVGAAKKITDLKKKLKQN